MAEDLHRGAMHPTEASVREEGLPASKYLESFKKPSGPANQPSAAEIVVRPLRYMSTGKNIVLIGVEFNTKFGTEFNANFGAEIGADLCTEIGAKITVDLKSTFKSAPTSVPKSAPNWYANPAYNNHGSQ